MRAFISQWWKVYSTQGGQGSVTAATISNSWRHAGTMLPEHSLQILRTPMPMAVCTVSMTRIISMLKGSSIINSMEQQGRLALLSIYIDEDLSAWHQGLSDYPDDWVTGYNQDLSIRDALVYDVRAIPSLYLLDRNKAVIFKDISTGMLMLQLETL